MWQLGAKTTQRKLCCCNTSRKVQISNNQWETYMISKKTSYTAKQTTHFPPYSFHAGLSSAKSVASASPCRQLFWWQAVTLYTVRVWGGFSSVWKGRQLSAMDLSSLLSRPLKTQTEKAIKQPSTTSGFPSRVVWVNTSRNTLLITLARNEKRGTVRGNASALS